MEACAKKWPIDPPSIFTQGSDNSENEAYRKDPSRGLHKHGPTCIGDVRALVYPLSKAARVCCEAEPKEEGEAPSLVKLRMCKESTHFSLGSFPEMNITLTSPDEIAEDDTEWQHLFLVRIYPDPDSDDVEVYNSCPRLAISIFSDHGEEARCLQPSSSLRLSADRTWAIKITKMHTFGIILRPVQDVYTALVDHMLDDVNSNKIFRCCTTKREKRKKLRVRFQNPGTDLAREGTSRTISLSNVPDDEPLSRRSDNTEDESMTIGSCTLPAVEESTYAPVVLFENTATRVEKVRHSGKIRVRKYIRTISLHRATQKWEEETRVLSGLQHPNIIRCIQFDKDDRSIDFEYGGKDLSKFQTETHLFDVARDHADVQMRIWIQATSALHYLHEEKRILHGDIKPQNILLSDDHRTVKLCDFGHARSLHKHDNGGGTPNYVAPEFLLRDGRSAASDVWSLGVTMLYVLGIIPLPYSDPDHDELWEINRVKDDRKERQKMVRWLHKVKQAIARVPGKWAVLGEMLDENPETRITSADLLRRLSTMSKMRTRSKRGDPILL